MGDHDRNTSIPTALAVLRPMINLIASAGGLRAATQCALELLDEGNVNRNLTKSWLATSRIWVGPCRSRTTGVIPAAPPSACCTAPCHSDVGSHLLSAGTRRWELHSYRLSLKVTDH